MSFPFPSRPLAELTLNFDAKRRPVKSGDRKPGPFPYYGAQGIVDHVHDYLFDGEYVLVAEDGENLRSRKEPVALLARGRFWVNNHAHILQGNEHADTRFLYYAINSADISGYVTGSTIPKLSQGSLNRVVVPCPPVVEQLEIVHLLGSLDDKIELNRRMNETLEAMAQAIFRDWFVDFGPTRRKLDGATDPVEIMGGLISDPDRARELAALFPATLGDDGLPEGWSEVPIGELAEIVGGSTPSTKTEEYWNDGNHIWATPKDLSKLDGLFLFDTERRITDAGLAKIGSGLSPAGTVLLSSRAPIGYLAIADAPTAINQGFIAIRPSPKLPTSMALLWCQANMDRIKASANGSTFQEISKRNFRPLTVVSASPKIVTRFDNIAAPMLELMRSRSHERRTLATTRDLLLPKLMSGEIRLRDAESELEAVA